MKSATQLIILIVFLLFGLSTAHAQRITEVGLNAGTARFYPEAQHLGSSYNNAMENGSGWSAGVFFEDHWKPKIHQVVEINYYAFTSDIYLQKNPDAPWSPYDGTGRQPIIGDFQSEPFNFLSVSGGIKYFLNKRLFVYPGFEWVRSLNKKVDVNKTTYNAKLGAGVNLKRIDILLEYAYGLNFLRAVYDPTVPFTSTHRNKYLQLKVQVPLLRVR